MQGSGYSSLGTVRTGRTYVTTRRTGGGAQVGRAGSNPCCSYFCFIAVTLAALGLSAWREITFFHINSALNEVGDAAVDCSGPETGFESLVECGKRSAGSLNAVFFSGPVEASASDPDFGVEVPGALKVHRKTEYCQWEEIRSESCTKNDDEDTETCVTSYSYVKAWRSYRINSLLFDQPGAHHNPQRDPFPSTYFPSQNAKIRDVPIDPEVLTRLQGVWHPVEWDTMDPPQRGQFIVDGFKFVRKLLSPLFTAFEWVRDSTLGPPPPRRQLSARMLSGTIEAPAAKEGFAYVGHGGFFFSAFEEALTQKAFRFLFEFLEGSIMDWQMGDLMPSCTAGDIRVSFSVQDPLIASVLGAPLANEGKIGTVVASNGVRLAIVSGGEVGVEEMKNRESMSEFVWVFLSRVLVFFLATFLWAPQARERMGRGGAGGGFLLQVMEGVGLTLLVLGIVMAGCGAASIGKAGSYIMIGTALWVACLGGGGKGRVKPDASREKKE